MADRDSMSMSSDEDDEQRSQKRQEAATSPSFEKTATGLHVRTFFRGIFVIVANLINQRHIMKWYDGTDLNLTHVLNVVERLWLVMDS